jgi:AbrB family transcriptional regulator, transcriptional pleiotropic regulator of transition state genes
VKSIGMSRKVDDLGRIVLPVELRRQLGIRAGDELDIAVDGVTVLLHKIESRCVFCDNVEGLRGYKEKQVCGDCVTELSAPAGSSPPSSAPAPSLG